MSNRTRLDDSHPSSVSADVLEANRLVVCSAKTVREAIQSRVGISETAFRRHFMLQLAEMRRREAAERAKIKRKRY